jgi:hypothetical protein
LLVGLATVILIVSSLTLWAKRQLLDSDAYGALSAEMLQDEEIRSVLSLYLVDTLYSDVDVAGALRRELPPSTQAFAPVAAAGLRQLSLRTANQLLAGPRVEALWEGANRKAHKGLIAILDEEPIGPFGGGGTVVLDLRPLVERLGSSGGVGEKLTARLPAKAGQITILTSDQLEAAQAGLKVLRALTVFLPLAALALYALAIFVARERRRYFLGASAASFIVAGVVLLVLVRLVGGAIVNALVSDDAVEPAASAAWSIGTSLLREMAIMLLIYGGVALTGVWLAGSTRPAHAIRRFLRPYFRDQVGVVFGVVGLVYLLVALGAPTPALERWWGILLFGVLVAVGVDLLRRVTLAESASVT